MAEQRFPSYVREIAINTGAIETPTWSVLGFIEKNAIKHKLEEDNRFENSDDGFGASRVNGQMSEVDISGVYVKGDPAFDYIKATEYDITKKNDNMVKITDYDGSSLIFNKCAILVEETGGDTQKTASISGKIMLGGKPEITPAV